jgi:hypothetical protein
MWRKQHSEHDQLEFYSALSGSFEVTNQKSFGFLLTDLATSRIGDDRKGRPPGCPANVQNPAPRSHAFFIEIEARSELQLQEATV